MSGRKPIAPAVRRPAPPVLRRPLTERCYALLERLRREGPSGSVRAEWTALWHDWQAEPAVDASDAHATGLLFHTGWSVAMAAGDPRAAAGYLDAYFRHPALDADDRLTRVSYRCNLAVSLLYAGDETEAVALFRSLLALKHRDSARLALATIRSLLLRYCRDRLSSDVASEGLAALVCGMAVRLRRKRMANKIQSGFATFSLLAEALQPDLADDHTPVVNEEGTASP